MRKGDDLTTFMSRVSRNSGALSYQKPKATRPVVEILYLIYIYIYIYIFILVPNINGMVKTGEIRGEEHLTCL